MTQEEYKIVGSVAAANVIKFVQRSNMQAIRAALAAFMAT